MLAYLGEDFGNPSSVHSYGRSARAAVEVARERVAHAIGASPAEVIFTGGGTEADNLAIKGAAEKLAGSGRHLVVSEFEHHGVLDAAHYLERHGFEVTLCPVEPSGHVAPQRIAELVRTDTILVSVMAVNNEIGTIQDLRAISEAVKAVNPRTLIHSDAVQALGNVPIDLHGWGVDLAAFSAHKIGGPKGTGACFIRAGVPTEPVIHGGGQEKGLRSGTLNVPGIAALGLAAEIAAKEVHEKSERLLTMRTRMLEGITLDRSRRRRQRESRGPCRRQLEHLHPRHRGRDACCCCSIRLVSPRPLDRHVSRVLSTLPTSSCRSGCPRIWPRAVSGSRWDAPHTDEDVDALLAALPTIVERARKVA